MKEKQDIINYAKKNDMNASEFVYMAVMEKMNINKINDGQSQFFNLYDMAFKKSYESYFKQLILILNRIEFNTRWLLKQQDIFMQHLKVPNNIEELNVSVIDHAIKEKSKEIVLKNIKKMKEKKQELEDE